MSQFHVEIRLSNGRCPRSISIFHLWGNGVCCIIPCAFVIGYGYGCLLSYIGVGFALSVLFLQAMRQHQFVERQQSESTFFYVCTTTLKTDMSNVLS